MIEQIRELLKKTAGKGEARFLADAWIEVWIDEASLELMDGFSELKNSSLPLEEKIKRAKDLARDLAANMISDMSRSGIKINWDGIKFDQASDSINWVEIFEGDEDMGLISFFFNGGLKRTAQTAIDIFTDTSEDLWLDKLTNFDSQNPMDESKLRELWNHFTQSFQREVLKIDPMMLELEKYNRFKRAFDRFAQSKGFEKWRMGTAQDEWLSP